MNDDSDDENGSGGGMKNIVIIVTIVTHPRFRTTRLVGNGTPFPTIAGDNPGALSPAVFHGKGVEHTVVAGETVLCNHGRLPQEPHTPSESPRHLCSRMAESVIVGYTL